MSLIFVILGLSTLEFYFRDTIKDISTIFFIISLILGIYLAYPVVMWIDRSLSYTDFGLWCRRIISGALVIIGGVLSIGIFLATSIITVAELQGKGPIVTSLTFTIFIAGFSVSAIRD